ncbi:hypothetical protein GCM10029978_011100 [Actinoallomurus acanthiterrae]
MNPGVQMNDNAEDMFRTLKPAGLDTVVAETHARRREQDLAKAWDGGGSDGAVSAPPVRRRVPRVLVAGLAAGAVAAAAAGVIVATDGSRGAGGARPAPSGTVRIMDARAVLLASADSAAKAPATTGTYWYTRVRETSLVRTFGEMKPGRGLPTPLLTAYVSTTRDGWHGRDRNSRVMVGIDPKITFPTPADEAKWKRMSLRERRRWGLDMTVKPRVTDLVFSSSSLTDRDKTTGALLKLPTDPAALERVLRTWYQHEKQEAEQRRDELTDDTFAKYLFSEASELLAGPLTPGAKAAVYRLLAKQPGIQYVGTATDPAGRKGAVLTKRPDDPDDTFGIRLIIDPKTGRLLAHESHNRKTLIRTVTYESMGWVTSLGARP